MRLTLSNHHQMLCYSPLNPFTLSNHQRPITLKGHERSITHITYNREGDLLFSCAKDNTPSVWFSDNGERLGTYGGHQGAVWHLDVSFDSTFLLSGSADATAKLWHVRTGRELFSFKHRTPVRAVGFAHGDQQFLTVQQSQMGYEGSISLYTLASSPSQQKSLPAREIHGHDGSINMALWGPLNRYIYSCGDDGAICAWDPETGALVTESREHDAPVNTISLSKDSSMLISSSGDHTARLFDPRSLDTVKVYKSNKPINAAVAHPYNPWMLLGGGQAAADVTTTSTRMGKFEVLFYDTIFEDEIGQCKGHFGPINSLAWHPNGKSFASGGEDGYVRINHLDAQVLAAGNASIARALKDESSAPPTPSAAAASSR